MAQPLWKTVCWFLTKLNILLPYNPAIILPSISSEELKLCSHKNLHLYLYSSFNHNCQNMEATKSPSVGERINEQCDIQTVEYYSVIK